MEPVGPQQEKEKKKRKRQKKLFAQIRSQMEFYFSNANLLKDRFLKKLMDSSEDGYIDLAIFEKFNRIQALTTDMCLVAKALSTSDLIQVSDDGQKVKRRKPVEDLGDADERTIYIEFLPQNTDHEMLKRLFSPYGNVVFVSIPRYKTSGDPKGFAFVEFEKAEESAKACEFMNNPPVSAPDRPGKFPRTNKQLRQLQKRVPIGKNAEVAVGASCDIIPRSELKTDGKGVRRTRKKKRSSGDSSFEDAPAEKQKRPNLTLDITRGDAIHEEKTSPPKEGRGWRKKKRASSSFEGENKPTSGPPVNEKTELANKLAPSDSKTDAVDQTEPVEKRRKTEPIEADPATTDATKVPEKQLKRKNRSEAGEDIEAKEAKRVRISKDVEVKAEGPGSVLTKVKRKRKKKHKLKGKDIPELRVIPKKEWMLLRDEYIAQQKNNMKSLKKSLKTFSQQVEQEKEKLGSSENIENANTATQGATKGPTLEFTPDVIVKISCKGVFSRKQVTEQASSCAAISYVDMKDGDEMGFIRCPNAESALKLVHSSLVDLQTTLLAGNEEKVYWDKILRDREAKRASKTRSKKRGTQKIIARAERIRAEVSEKKHVIFDD